MFRVSPREGEISLRMLVRASCVKPANRSARAVFILNLSGVGVRQRFGINLGNHAEYNGPNE